MSLSTLKNVANLSRNVNIDLYNHFEDTLLKSGKISLYDINSTPGNKIYERGLLYLFELSAIEALGTDTKIMVKYSIDKGIYCKIDKPLILEDINKIKKIMKLIIHLKL